MVRGGTPFSSVIGALSATESVVVPWVQNALLSGRWPESYQVTVDSGPYYGAGDGYFHPSTHAMMGARELYYRFHPDHRDQLVHENRTAGSEIAMSVGSAIHAVFQTQLIVSGLVSGPDACEVEYVIEDHNVRGRADFLVDHPDGTPYVGELKTISSRGFNLQETIKPSWDAQLSMALHGLGRERGVLVMLEVGYPYRMREFVIGKNEKLLQSVFDKFDHVRECIAAGTPPAHCCALDSVEMKSCPARFECWLSDGRRAP